MSSHWLLFKIIFLSLVLKQFDFDVPWVLFPLYFLCLEFIVFLVTRGLQFASTLEKFRPSYLRPFFLSSLLPLLLPGFRTDAPEVAPWLTCSAHLVSVVHFGH